MSWPSSRIRPLDAFSRPTTTPPSAAFPPPASPPPPRRTPQPEGGTVGPRERHVGDGGDLPDPALHDGPGGDGEVLHHPVDPQKLTRLGSGGGRPRPRL